MTDLNSPDPFRTSSDEVVATTVARQRETAAPAGRRHCSFKWLAAAAVLGIAAFLAWQAITWQPAPEPPQFLSRSGPASFAEMMAEPPTFIYGSSIHVWVYERQGKPIEIEVTGHADATSCSRASGVVLNSMLEKAEEPEDLLVAGAARLVSHEDPRHRDQLLQRDAVRRFVAMQDEATRARIALHYAREGAVQSGSEVPAVKQLTAKAAELDKELGSLKQQDDVAAYRRETASGEALGALVRETARLASTSGLVTLHHLPAELVDKVRARIARAAAAGTLAVVAFDDLLRDANQLEAVVLVDALRVGSAMPLVLEIPAAELSSEAFDEAVASNRQGVEYAMVGDAEERRRFYRTKLGEFDDEIAGCSKLSASARAQIIRLEEECTADGVCFHSSQPIQMPRGEYCDRRVPQNMAVIRVWDDQVADVLRDLQQDKAPEGGRVDHMNHTMIIDSLLRDWALPLSRGQAAFDRWRTELRRPTWQILRRNLAAQGVAETAVSGEHVVFSVRRQGAAFSLHPVHVIDLARSVVVIDPRAGATRVVDAWALRELVRDAERPSADERRRAVGQVDRALALAERGDDQAADIALREALAIDAPIAVGRIDERWRAQVRDDHVEVADLVARTQTTLRTAGLEAALGQLRAQDTTDEPLERFKRELVIVSAYPEAPVDLHLWVALELASLIGALDVKQSGSDEKPVPWDVIEAVALSAPSIRYRAARAEAHKLLGEDPVQAIRAAIKLISDRAPDYLDRARQARGFPVGSSGEIERAVAKLSSLSLFETEAVVLEKLRRILVQAGAAARASERVASQGTPDLRKILNELEQAAASDASAPLPLITSARDRVKQLIKDRYQPDTLARMEVASAASRGRDQLVRFAGTIVESEYPWLRGLRDHTRLGARAHYEAGDYGTALTALFPETVALALAHPALRWERLPGDWAGTAGALGVREDGDTLLVAASRAGQRHDVLRLSGLDRAERQALARRIAAARWTSPSRGRISDQVLMLQLPADAGLAALGRLVRGTARLAVVRAMVYACAPPASELIPIPPGGRCQLASGVDRYDRLQAAPITAVHVPPLAVVRATAYGR